MKLLIIGGVAGGATAAARARRLDEHAHIVLFERGEYISFANCGLPYYIGGIIPKRSDLLVTTPDALTKRYNIDIRIFSEVTRIDRARKEVEVKNRRTGEVYRESYDRIILAPGAEPLKPPIPGIDLPQIFSLRNIPDSDRIAAASRRTGTQIGPHRGRGLHQSGNDREPRKEGVQRHDRRNARPGDGQPRLRDGRHDRGAPRGKGRCLQARLHRHGLQGEKRPHPRLHGCRRRAGGRYRPRDRRRPPGEQTRQGRPVSRSARRAASGWTRPCGRPTPISSPLETRSR